MRRGDSQPVEGRPDECLISWLASGAGGVGGGGQQSLVMSALARLHHSLQLTLL